MCRALVTYFSRNTPASPKLPAASRRTLSKARARSSGVAHSCMPMPAAAAVLFSITGSRCPSPPRVPPRDPRAGHCRATAAIRSAPPMRVRDASGRSRASARASAPRRRYRPLHKLRRRRRSRRENRNPDESPAHRCASRHSSRVSCFRSRHRAGFPASGNSAPPGPGRCNTPHPPAAHAAIARRLRNTPQRTGSRGAGACADAAGNGAAIRDQYLVEHDTTLRLKRQSSRQGRGSAAGRPAGLQSISIRCPGENAYGRRVVGVAGVVQLRQLEMSTSTSMAARIWTWRPAAEMPSAKANPPVVSPARS